MLITLGYGGIVMKKVLFGLMGFVVVSIFNVADARSMIRPERPTQYAYMNKDYATQDFVSAENVVLTLTQLAGSDEATGMVLNFHDSKTGTFKTEVLEIVTIQKDACGSTIYNAALYNAEPPQSRIALHSSTSHMEVMPVVPFNGRRLNITLQDHTNRLCHDVINNLWEAHVREGFGWCGTMDSTMDISGKPEVIDSIQLN